ncbi:LuxR C-terminal-related transcriptional regulator [Streptomyces sp. NPDC050433]|uniref:helix-turn-helix transcriptional regulator n=1 Tax=Streptomyces sp. NPDC050433 TaxID=3365615 RepID=UPI0037BAD38F
MDPRILDKLSEAATPQSQSAGWSLYGREEQVHRIERLMRATAEERRAHLVVVEAGIGTGKTRLLSEAMALAERNGFAVFNGVPKSITMVGPRQGRHDTDRISWLAAQVESQLDAGLRRGPVLLVLDDAQWTDPAVLRALGGLMPKLDDSPVLWLVALRAERGESSNSLVLRGMTRAQRGEWLGPLGPLSSDAVVGLVGDLFGAAPDSDLVELCESVGGNPQAIVDLVRELGEEHCVVVGDGIASLGTGPMNSGIAVAVAEDPVGHLPPPFLRSVRGRLDELSQRAQNMLQVAAVLGSAFTPNDLAEMLGERPVQLLGPLQEAMSAGLLSSDSEGFVFHREPVWRAVLGTVPAPLRSILHRQAATMLLVSAGEPTLDVAVHLVHCTEVGDAEAVATIGEAARRLLPSSPQSAAALATRALRATDPGGPDHLALGTTATAGLVRQGRLTEAAELAEKLLQVAGSAPEESIRPLRSWLAMALMLRGDASAAQQVSRECSSAEASADGPDPTPELLVLNTLSSDNQTAKAGLADRVLAGPGAYSVEVRMAALNVRAMASWREGRLDEALASVEDAVGLREQLTESCQSDPLWTKAWMLTRLHRLDEALAAADTARRTIDCDGTGAVSPVPLALRAMIFFVKGDIAAAETEVAAGLAASRRVEMPLYDPPLRAVLVFCALRRGDLAAAVERLRRLGESMPAEAVHRWSVMWRLLTGLVSSAKSGAHAAIDEIRELARDPALRRQLVLEAPLGTAWSVRTALAADQRPLAEQIVATAEEIASVNQRHGPVVAAARHGRALLDCDLTALAGIGELYGDPWTVASVTEDLGSLHRGTDREQAVKQLSHAMAIYEEVGAEWDSARVRRKLRRLGVRRRHWSPEARPETGWSSLTGTESKVARLVAQGLTNRQVASELFISPHTVGFHLRQIYRKLAIQSRVDLARIVP